MTYAIEIHQLTKNFGKPKTMRVPALDKVELVVPKGEIFALLGPNGAGKTTLIKILCSLVLPESGTAKINGFDVVREQKKIRSSVSLLVGEERSFYWQLTGRQNLEFFGALYNLHPREVSVRIETASRMFGIKELDKRYREYSTGMRQRLALARVLLHDASIIFMDEPTRSLDPNAQNALHQLIREHFHDTKRTFFFTTHDTHEAERLADRIGILDRGKILACGTLEDLRTQYGCVRGSLESIFKLLTYSKDLRPKEADA